jgi:GNAT superfamily N-acetyltransferase
MSLLRHSSQEHLDAIADCHIKCFPSSLSTKLGKAYVKKTLEWFLASEYRFLFHVQDDNNMVVGFCGGFAPQKIGDGSASGMLQYAFNEAIKGVLKKPWLIFNNEVREQYPLIWKNVKRKIFKPGTATIPQSPKQAFKPLVGLVVIGVEPSSRGNGIAQQLMTEFEANASRLKIDQLVLSVKKDNARAIKAYENFGWKIDEAHKKTYVMRKLL